MEFDTTFSYKLIYIFRINDGQHNGLLKIGDTSIDTNTTALKPNSNPLNEAAKRRIHSYTHTAGVSFELLHTELAIRTVNRNGKQKTECFRDHLVHQVLKRSGISNYYFDKENQRNEWFKTDLATAKHAIKAVKEGRLYLDPNEKSEDNSPIIFRPEQKKAIKDTLSQFKKGDRMLWNAKMRFGKTLSALQMAKDFPFKKILICTHRPVVNDGWFEDFNTIFRGTTYKFGSKTKGTSIEKLIDKDVEEFVYFASMQDLRGSAAVGGKFEKNEYIFLVDWDLIIVDEAHEGTQTDLGQKVLETIISNNPKKLPKLLELSGTPFNLFTQFKEGEIFTWDYIMEQEAKEDWLKNHFGDSNPYEDLPKLEIYTYDLDKDFPSYTDLDDKAFNFKEFFRTWTGDVQKDYKRMPPNVKIGDFVHEKDVKAFLNLLTDSSSNNNYPFSTKEYQSFFRHTLWMVPGVKEAKALSKLLKEHEVFGNPQFYKIANVAGDGDEEQEYNDALKEVRAAIGENPDEHYSITLSCGRLTTGVTIPEWTGVLMLAGSFSTSAANYMQTIFRVQTPANINGRMKERCCVFDFAPDRTLKMVAEASQVAAKVGKTSSEDRVLMGKFLNFCPVIAVQGSKMEEYKVSTLLQQLKKAYTDRVVKNGFDDKHLYNDNLLKLDELELKDFENLQKIVKSAKQANTPQNDFKINEMGFTEEEYEHLQQAEKKPKKELSDEDKALLEEKRKKQENARKAISILRAISIRIPLLIYGVDVPAEKEINSDNFVELIDDNSWEEFMPKGVSKELFKKFSKYYEQDVFIAAGKQIRAMAKAADELSPTERVEKLANLFATFKNPDKETVLTPWRVVNMHLGECLGGYNFYNETFENQLDEPRFISHGKVTEETLANSQAHILEINSKTGLYPLYVTYSLYRAKLEKMPMEQRTLEMQNKLWQETVQNNVFVICKTPMAKAITRRTLLGYKNGKINAHYFEDLVNQLKNKPEQFRNKVLKGSFWNREENVMQFDAIVGNPPYQVNCGSGGRGSGTALPIYQCFVQQAIHIAPRYVTLIIPARWYSGGRNLDAFRSEMLNDGKITKLVDYSDSKDCFPCVDIAGGICYFLRCRDKKSPNCIVENHFGSQIVSEERPLNKYDVFIRNNRAVDIVEKAVRHKEQMMSEIVSPVSLFGLNTNFKVQEKGDLQVRYSGGFGLCRRKDVTETPIIEQYKTIISAASYDHGGQTDKNGQRRILSIVECLPPKTICTSTYIVVNSFDTQQEAENLKIYLKTHFVRFLISQVCISQHLSRECFKFVPVQDFTQAWTDEKLYKKYGLTVEEINFIETMIKPME